MERLDRQVDAYIGWKRDLIREITRYRSWLAHNRLTSEAVDARLERALRLLRTDHITLAFVGEFSRGKTELINSLFFANFGRRILPSQAGRTTMCPTELFFDPRSERSYIRLLPISYVRLSIDRCTPCARPSCSSTRARSVPTSACCQSATYV